METARGQQNEKGGLSGKNWNTLVIDARMEGGRGSCREANHSQKVKIYHGNLSSSISLQLPTVADKYGIPYFSRALSRRLQQEDLSIFQTAPFRI